jgi:hypothetical protein
MRIASAPGSSPGDYLFSFVRLRALDEAVKPDGLYLLRRLVGRRDAWRVIDNTSVGGDDLVAGLAVRAPKRKPETPEPLKLFGRRLDARANVVFCNRAIEYQHSAPSEGRLLAPQQDDRSCESAGEPEAAQQSGLWLPTRGLLIPASRQRDRAQKERTAWRDGPVGAERAMGTGCIYWRFALGSAGRNQATIM